jgi:hypothetical protein
MARQRNPQRWYKSVSNEVTFDCLDQFHFRADKKWHRLQRLCLWVLKKIGAQAQQTSTVWTRYPMENDELLLWLMGQHEEWMELAYRQPCRIFIGPEQNMKLLRLGHELDFRPITLDARIGLDGDAGYKLLDMPITVVPWLDGAYIVPVK